MRYIAFLLFVAVIATGCSSKQKAAEVHEKETISKTVWTAKTEMFMEYDKPKLGQKTAVLIHLTNLKDFKPVAEGPLTIAFTPEQGDPVTGTVDKPEKPGIFKTDVTFKQSGSYTLTASLKGKTFSDEITVPDIDVISGEGKHDEAYQEEKSGGDIS